ncbi:hypothetical protein HO173_002452 [Letharia columbiana]|uniref:Uncharacterized protein n=1 Tax=Letharia columbiana TaxID=112416 RepID=A0A8H6G276_9LECA|nr:uncharacterized protein HO173_002452 [Letharia columbiana]KAF6239191.1 hypothetical protein HO173_002452 [Letharia columbiana]
MILCNDEGITAANILAPECILNQGAGFLLQVAKPSSRSAKWISTSYQTNTKDIKDMMGKSKPLGKELVNCTADGLFLDDKDAHMLIHDARMRFSGSLVRLGRVDRI